MSLSVISSILSILIAKVPSGCVWSCLLRLQSLPVPSSTEIWFLDSKAQYSSLPARKQNTFQVGTLCCPTLLLCNVSIHTEPGASCLLSLFASFGLALLLTATYLSSWTFLSAVSDFSTQLQPPPPHHLVAFSTEPFPPRSHFAPCSFHGTHSISAVALF